MEAEKFQIRFPDSEIEELKQRLKKTRWPAEHPSTMDGQYGIDQASMREIISYWHTQYDWRKQEAYLNTFPHYRMQIDDLRIHFIHQSSTRANAIPLVMTHGWPGSFLEMLKILPLLKNDFHVIVPSLPGYAFSDAPEEPGMHPRKIASLWVRMMTALGYQRFIAQGGDWGATVSTWLALDYPQNTAGLHLNYIPGSYAPFNITDPPMSEAETSFVKQQTEWRQTEGAYSHIQATKPLTAAYALSDSPAGLAAWIVEKIRDWSDCRGDIRNRFTLDEVLTNVQIYWLTKSYYSSARLYAEGSKMPMRLAAGQRIEPPCAVARFPLEAPMPPRAWVERGFNLVRWTEMSSGGHFGAWEEPALLAEDLRQAADLLWNHRATSDPQDTTVAVGPVAERD